MLDLKKVMGSPKPHEIELIWLQITYEPGYKANAEAQGKNVKTYIQQVVDEANKIYEKYAKWHLNIESIT